MTPDDPQEALKAELAELRAEHRRLDAEISALSDMAGVDRLGMQRLKKRKLFVKDRIARIEDELYPDIIA